MNRERPHHNSMPSEIERWQLEQEKDYWFNRAMRAENNAADATRQLNEADELIASYRQTISNQTERLNLITELHLAMNKTGWRCSWHIGGITSEALISLLAEARAYTPPMRRSSVSSSLAFHRPNTKDAKDHWVAYAQKLELELKRVEPAINWKKLSGGKLV